MGQVIIVYTRPRYSVYCIIIFFRWLNNRSLSSAPPSTLIHKRHDMENMTQHITNRVVLKPLGHLAAQTPMLCDISQIMKRSECDDI